MLHACITTNYLREAVFLPISIYTPEINIIHQSSHIITPSIPSVIAVALSSACYSRPDATILRVYHDREKVSRFEVAAIIIIGNEASLMVPGMLDQSQGHRPGMCRA